MSSDTQAPDKFRRLWDLSLIAISSAFTLLATLVVSNYSSSEDIRSALLRRQMNTLSEDFFTTNSPMPREAFDADNYVERSKMGLILHSATIKGLARILGRTHTYCYNNFSKECWELVVREENVMRKASGLSEIPDDVFMTFLTGGGLADRLNTDFRSQHSISHADMTAAPAQAASLSPTSMANPAPTASTSQVARTYLVFFAWGESSIINNLRLVRAAAHNAILLRSTNIDVVGYTDGSGESKHDPKLSIHRAEAVATELVKDGVPRNAVFIQALGDSPLLVPVPPHTREPQNRRVEIIIR